MQKCDSCRYWRRAGNRDEKLGHCRRLPPSQYHREVVNHTRDPGVDVYESFFYTQTYETDWCGEFAYLFFGQAVKKSWMWLKLQCRQSRNPYYLLIYHVAVALWKMRGRPAYKPGDKYEFFIMDGRICRWRRR